MKKILLILATIMVYACSEDSKEPELVEEQKKEEEKKEESNNTTEKITYTAHIKPIMDASCVSCHGDTNPRAGLSLTTYDKVKSAQASVIYRMNNSSNPMPPNGLLAQSKRDIMDKWKAGGFLEN